MSDRFYTPDPLAIGDYVLEGAEAHHLGTVRRFVAGDHIVVFNGDGSEYPAQVVSVARRNVVLHIENCLTPQRERSCPLVVASALPKGDRADFLIEKLTELGVSRFIPLVTERSVVRPKENIVEKFERAVIEASKQCGRNCLMVIEPPSSWEQLLARTDLPSLRHMLHTAGDTLRSVVTREGTLAAIGPEGGFTPGEVERARNAGWELLCIGPRILRTETAALAAATLLSVE